MSMSASEEFQRHPLWDELRMKIRAIRQASWEGASADQLKARENVLELLSDAASCQKHPNSGAFLELLPAIQGEIGNIRVSPDGVHNYRLSRYPYLAQHVRSLPSPGVQQLSARYAEALDRAVVRREAELMRLGQSIGDRKKELKAVEEQVAKLRAEAAALSAQATESAAALTAITENAATTIDTEWQAQLSRWQTERDKADREHVEHASAELALLAGSARVGAQLLARGGGNYAANEWKARAVRERKSGLNLRRGAIAAGILGIASAAFFIAAGKSEWFAAGWENVPLRLTLSLLLGGLAAYLGVESRRHLREADSSDEIVTAITALEPFMANSSPEVIASKRAELADEVLVKNVRSRLGRRDATKSEGLASDQLDGLIESLTRAAKIINADGKSTS